MRTTLLPALVLLLVLSVSAQEAPNFVTYDHHMEEPGNLEISTQSTFGVQKRGLPTFWAPLLEFEYGVTDRWSSALYLEAASQRHDATVFTGWRLENRFKPLKGEHKINPVLYFEFENINEASRIKKEIVGHAEPAEETLGELRSAKARELEGKLILSSDVHNWNISENFIVEKNLSAPEAVEFGYAFGVYRPLVNRVTSRQCGFCRDNLMAGVEVYGGLGTTEQFGFKETAQYIAPGLLWRMGQNSTFKVSPSFGVTGSSDRMLLRIGYTYEVNALGRKISHLFGGN